MALEEASEAHSTSPRGDSAPEVSRAVRAARNNRSRLFLVAAIIGLCAGFVAVLFAWSLHRAEDLRYEAYARLRDVPFGWAVMPLVGAIVGGVIGAVVQRWAPETKGSGIPHIKGVLLRLRTLDWRRVLPVKFGAGVLGLGIGLSLGREGPTVQLGAAVAQGVGRAFGVSPKLLPQLIACGAGAGLSAAFNAPLAGFIFVIEELRREMSAITYGAALVAAVSANVVARALTGELPSFHVGSIPTTPLEALPAVLVLGVIGGMAGVGFNKGLLGGQKLAKRATKRVPTWTLVAGAGALVGLAGWWMPSILGGGHRVADQVLTGNYSTIAWQVIAALLVGKLAATLISYASGAPGGIFAPMLLLGALLGLLVGRVLGSLMPSLGIHETTFAVLGMAAWFTGSVRAPLTCIVLVMEMTGDQDHLFALCVVCLSAYLIAERLHDKPIYEALLAADLRDRGLSDSDDEEHPTHVVMSVQTGSPLDGKMIREAPWPNGSLVVGVERGGHEMVPTGSLQLRPGDHITVLVPPDPPGTALRIVELCQVP